MGRKVQGLKWARVLAERPKCIPASRPRGAKAAGLRYERELAQALPAARHGVWFEFQDNNGLGFCQVDLMLPLTRGIVVLEAKYTWTSEGHGQIEGLYAPVLEAAFQLPVRGIVVCKKLVPGIRGVEIATSLPSALELAASGRRVALHWLGNVPLGLHEPRTMLASTQAGCAPGPRELGL